MPISALPPELQDVENHFPDDDQYGTSWFGKAYRWYQKSTKTWFCFSYRCTESWARWRKYPKVLFAIGGKGSWRYESEIMDVTSYLQIETGKDWYLSRIQYYKRWYFAVQWPLMVSGHIYFKAKDVPDTSDQEFDVDGKLIFAFWNHFDADLIYWMLTSMYLGANFK